MNSQSTKNNQTYILPNLYEKQTNFQVLKQVQMLNLQQKRPSSKQQNNSKDSKVIKRPLSQQFTTNQRQKSIDQKVNNQDKYDASNTKENNILSSNKQRSLSAQLYKNQVRINLREKIKQVKNCDNSEINSIFKNVSDQYSQHFEKNQNQKQMLKINNLSDNEFLEDDDNFTKQSPLKQSSKSFNNRFNKFDKDQTLLKISEKIRSQSSSDFSDEEDIIQKQISQRKQRQNSNKHKEFVIKNNKPQRSKYLVFNRTNSSTEKSNNKTKTSVKEVKIVKNFSRRNFKRLSTILSQNSMENTILSLENMCLNQNDYMEKNSNQKTDLELEFADFILKCIRQH